MANPSAEDAHFVELKRRLEWAVRTVCPQWSTDRHDDLVQNCLIRLMKIERKSEGIRDYASSYLRRVAHSVVVDEVRRLRQRQEISLEDGEHQEPPSSPAADPERSQAGGEIARAIRECLGLQGRPRRRAVALYLQGHSVPQAARLLGWTNKRTENLVYRGLARLRECLASKGLEP